MATCLIGLGSNLGERSAVLKRAVEQLAAHPDITLTAHSRLHPSRPAGGPPGQGEFLNAAACLETSLPPHQLLGVLLEIEADLGRQRSQRWAARILDLDLLLYDQLAFETPALQLPHPRMAFRRFVLAPALEVAPEMVHPTTGWTIRQLVEHLDTAADYVAIGGAPAMGKTWLAQSVLQQTPGIWIANPARRCSHARQRDSASQMANQDLELLHRRTKLLAKTSFPPQGSWAIWGISDFWFDQSLVYARWRLSGPAWEQFHEAWQETRSTVTTPKLLVLLDATAEWLIEHTAGQQSAPQEPPFSLEQREQLRGGLRERSLQAAPGPVLYLDAGEPQRAVSELAAAMEAMS